MVPRAAPPLVRFCRACFSARPETAVRVTHSQVQLAKSLQTARFAGVPADFIQSVNLSIRINHAFRGDCPRLFNQFILRSHFQNRA